MSLSLMNQSQESARPAPTGWELVRGEALSLDIGPGLRELQVLQGRVWMTRRGTLAAPADDVWLAAGETVSLDAGSVWVLEAADDSARFQLLVPPRACAAMARRLKVSASASTSSSTRRWPWASSSPARAAG